MKRPNLLLNALTVFAGWSLAAPVYAIDHNNIDSGRPLRFEDAESIALREQAFEFGFGLGVPRRGKVGLGAKFEYLYGFALNSHFSIDFDPSIGGRAGSRDTRFNQGDTSIGLLHNFNREYNNTPAFALRTDVIFPTGRSSRGVGYRLRGIMSKIVTQYDRLHLNVDLNATPAAPVGDRRLSGVITLGYTRPLGYPRRFDTTGLAEISVRQSERKGEGEVISVGLGLRRQVSVRSVFDIGIQSDVAGFQRAPRETVRLVAGYSNAF